MKKTLFLVAALCAITLSFGASTPTTPRKALKATEVYLPAGKSGQLISLYDLSRISAKEMQTLTGKKMNFFDRMGFKVAQHKLRSNINADGTFNTKKMEKQIRKANDVTSGFHLGGFALGFFLTIIGVLIAYLINDDKKAARVKWAWIGFILSLVIWLIVAIV